VRNATKKNPINNRLKSQMSYSDSTGCDVTFAIEDELGGRIPGAAAT
jgi:hypothetical protein